MLHITLSYIPSDNRREATILFNKKMIFSFFFSHPYNLEDTKTPKKEFICDICGYISKSSSTLYNHKGSLFVFNSLEKGV